MGRSLTGTGSREQNYVREKPLPRYTCHYDAGRPFPEKENR